MEENKELIDEIEQVNEELKDSYTPEEVVELLQEAIPSIEIDTELCQNLKINSEDFQKGLDQVSSICGMLSAFMSTGLSKELALELTQNIILTDKNHKNNIEVAKINQNNMSQTQI